MYRSHGLYVPTHRPLPVSSVKADIKAAIRDTRAPSTAPFRLTKALLTIGFLLTAAAIAASLS
ncbi:hypothetical protein LHFGNBLO_002014 [Mesorhizobium sp. AR10]|uniref:hypothetical protein n=1 Tax=Mesorhizobium sp. AR10 TaxID=2865839 RepID=UPI00215DF9FD|nr:hypothetical protein [Mesorhizobium sp. AR10]UVK40541.1 hypothetical protein LHFGNBLO_002014 [Mesorhizobium sp. AR10]